MLYEERKPKILDLTESNAVILVQAALEIVEQEIEKRFPNSFQNKNLWKDFKLKIRELMKGSTHEKDAESLIAGAEKRLRQSTTLNVDDGNFQFSCVNFSYWGNKSFCVSALYELACFTKGEIICGEQVVEQIKTEIQNKKILILGDDVGSFSEVLSSFGASVIGIEIDPLKIAIAHSGFFSEDGSSQDQVIAGDIADLAYPDSQLSKKLRNAGPFSNECNAGTYHLVS